MRRRAAWASAVMLSASSRMMSLKGGQGYFLPWTPAPADEEASNEDAEEFDS